MVAQQTLTLFVWVQILVPQPYRKAKKDIMALPPEIASFRGVFSLFIRFSQLSGFAVRECRKKDIVF